jgi:hypothetical protein
MALTSLQLLYRDRNNLYIWWISAESSTARIFLSIGPAPRAPLGCRFATVLRMGGVSAEAM